MSSQWVFGLFLDNPKYFWAEYHHQYWLSWFGIILQSTLVWRWPVTLGWMVCQMNHGMLWSGLRLKGGIGAKICMLDPFWWMDPLSLLKPLTGFEYLLPHHSTSDTPYMWQLVAAWCWCLSRDTIFNHCQLFNSATRFCHCCCARGGVLWVTPILFYKLQFCKQMKNESKMGLRGRQGGDEVRCEHACNCNAIAMQSLVSEIALHFLFPFWNW